MVVWARVTIFQTRMTSRYSSICGYLSASSFLWEKMITKKSYSTWLVLSSVWRRFLDIASTFSPSWWLPFWLVSCGWSPQKNSLSVFLENTPRSRDGFAETRAFEKGASPVTDQGLTYSGQGRRRCIFSWCKSTTERSACPPPLYCIPGMQSERPLV